MVVWENIEKMHSLFGNILAARGTNIDKWVPFLIVAFVIVVNIIKVIARGIKSMSQQDGIKNEPVRQKKTTRYASADRSYKTLEQLRDEKISQIRAIFGIQTPPEEYEEEIYLAPSPPPIPEPSPQSRPRSVHKHKPILKHAAVPQSKNIHTASNAYTLPNDSPISVSQKTSDDVYDFHFSSPQDLRKAILYQEILGKPVSLRD